MSQLHCKEASNGPRPAFLAAAFICACLFLAAATPARAAVSSFDVKVPHKAFPQQEIFLVKITVSVTSGNAMNPLPAGPINITLTRDGGAATGTAMNLTANGANSGNIGIGGDTMKVFSPTAALANSDPLKRKYLIVLNLLSNVNFGTCASLSPAGPDETWTVSVSGAQFDGACAQSLDRNAGGGACTTGLPAMDPNKDTFRSVPPNDAATPATSIATIVGQAGSTLGCRPGVDCVLVLDRSGSMDESAPGGMDPAQTKLGALKTAVSNFMTTWTALRANEVSSSVMLPADRVGVLLFDDSNPAPWLKDLFPASSLTAGMDLMSSGVATEITTRTNTVVTAGGTSIGSGLKRGDTTLTPLAGNGNRKVFVVMTDGMENTDPQTRINPMDSTRVQTTIGSTGTNLTNQPPAQIYALTIGPSGTINPTINQNMATASGGFYLNSEYDPAILSNFFTEVLQNFIKYSTVETYLMVSKQTSLSAPFTRTLPVTNTTTSLTFTLSWNANQERLKLTVTPPGGAPPIVRTVALGDTPGSMVLNVPLNVKGSPKAGGDWGIRIEPDPPGIGFLPPVKDADIPFNLIVLGDDTSLNSDLTTVAADYAPGDQIRLSARVTEMGDPLAGLNTQPGAAVVAELIRPDKGGIGDLLSASTAGSGPSSPSDQRSPADAKLANVLKANPDAIARANDTIQLLDNGSAANGDAVAGDGVYSALFPAQLIGHYNFLFGVTGKSKDAGRFSRQQLRTVHVRAVPDGNNTTATATIQGGNVLVIDMTPLTKFNNHLGPGWGNYFWVTGSGVTPTKFSDNLNGTYTAKLPFSGNPPSDVKIHFEHVNERIPDSATANNLPVPLGNGTVIVSHVNVPGGGGGSFKHWGLSLHAGASIPHGNFNNLFNPGPNFGVDLEYRFNSTFSLEGIYTFHRFRGETLGSFKIGDQNLHQFSVNGKIYGGASPVRPFFNFGGGAYKFNPGDVRGGINVGGGLQFDVTPTFAVDAMYNFNNLFTFGSNLTFSTVQGGVRFRF
jgi:hypothetical protein